MGRADGTFTIGELSRRTGLPVKTIRFYSDEGLLPPADRTGSGYRLYDVTAMARLELIKTLRELGLGLTDVAAVLAEVGPGRLQAAEHGVLGGHRRLAHLGLELEVVDGPLDLVADGGVVLAHGVPPEVSTRGSPRHHAGAALARTRCSVSPCGTPFPQLRVG